MFLKRMKSSLLEVNEKSSQNNINFLLTYVSNQISLLENSDCNKDFTDKNIQVYLNFHNTILKNYLESKEVYMYDSLGALSNLNLHLKNINQKKCLSKTHEEPINTFSFL